MNYNRLTLVILCMMMAASTYSQIYSSLEKEHRQITHTPDYQYKHNNALIFTNPDPSNTRDTYQSLYEERLARGLFNTVASEIKGGVLTTDGNSDDQPQHPRGPQRSPGVPGGGFQPLDFDWSVIVFLAILAAVFGRKKILSSRKQKTC